MMNAGKQEIKVKRVSSRKRSRDSQLKSHRTPVKKKGKATYFRECSKNSRLDSIMADIKATEVWCCPNKAGIIRGSCDTSLKISIYMYLLKSVIPMHVLIIIIKLIFTGSKTLRLSCFCPVLQWQWGFIWRLWQYPGGQLSPGEAWQCRTKREAAWDPAFSPRRFCGCSQLQQFAAV